MRRGQTELRFGERGRSLVLFTDAAAHVDTILPRTLSRRESAGSTRD
jgi:hypothetical protein